MQFISTESGTSGVMDGKAVILPLTWLKYEGGKVGRINDTPTKFL